MRTFNKIDIYFSRLVSALCLFWVLAEANVWLDATNNIILVLGYRLFILLTPCFFLVFRHKLTFAAFFILEVGIGLWVFNFTFLGTIFFAIGISISGYMLKYYSCFSIKGVTGNKIALNLGSILSGCFIILSQNKLITLIACFFMILFASIAFFKYFKRENISNFKSCNHFKFNIVFSKQGIAWSIIGFVIGVKLIALVSILPQFLLQGNDGKLPWWFGGMIILNSLIVVVLQIPIMKKVSKFNQWQALIPLFVGMFIILLSPTLYITTFIGSLIWTITLSIVECCISYLDKLAQDKNCLLIKEAFVGLGSASTVYFVRFFPPQLGSFYIGFISILALLVSLSILHILETNP